MYLSEFLTKLRRLNSRLYVGERGAVAMSGEWHALGLYERRVSNRHQTSARLLSEANDVDRKYLGDRESGATDDFVCGIPAGWVPEGDVFDEQGKLLARGWRSIVCFLVKSNRTTWDKARKHFGAGIGTSTYDKADFHGKRAYVQRLTKQEFKKNRFA